MARENRMSRLLHALIHLDRHMDRAPSSKIADMLDTNPVVVRRLMAGLREAGIVRSITGSGGGWELSKTLDTITLRDIHDAIGRPALVNIGVGSERPECLVEQAIEERLTEALMDAENRLLLRFASITVADVAEDFDRKYRAIFGEGTSHEAWRGGE